jgi:hypothetical protein
MEPGLIDYADMRHQSICPLFLKIDLTFLLLIAFLLLRVVMLSSLLLLAAGACLLLPSFLLLLHGVSENPEVITVAGLPYIVGVRVFGIPAVAFAPAVAGVPGESGVPVVDGAFLLLASLLSWRPF